MNINKIVLKAQINRIIPCITYLSIQYAAKLNLLIHALLPFFHELTASPLSH